MNNTNFLLQLLTTRGAKQKAADSFLAAFFICGPSKGEKSPSGTAERKENVQWTFLAEGRAVARAKMIKPLYCNSVAVFLFLKYGLKLKNEHFWLLIFALNFISFQLLQDYIRPQYMGDSIPIRYFLDVAPNFFPAIGIPSLFMVLIPILLINEPDSWFVLNRQLYSNVVSVTGLIGWEIFQVTGKLVFDWHNILWTLLGGYYSNLFGSFHQRFLVTLFALVLFKCRVHDVLVLS